MPRKPDAEPKRTDKHLTNSCTCMQEPEHFVRSFRQTTPADLRSLFPENQAGEYSSPVCYAHLREFREGF
jgi:hypothetical protein